MTDPNPVAPRLLVPVDHIGELPLLLASGAGGFYGGIVPDSWARLFPEAISINRRNFPEAQFGSVAELSSAIARTVALGREFHLVLNLSAYPSRLLPLVTELVGEVAEAGLTGVILADPDLATTLHRSHPSLALTASTMAGVTSTGGVDFYRGCGVSSFVLPRYLTIGETVAIAEAYPDCRFESFLLMGKCPNLEESCRLFHCHPRRVWPCVQRYRPLPSEADPAPGIDGTGWEGFPRQEGCGLCSLGELLPVPNIRFKIVGRGAPTERKLSAIAAAVAVGEAGDLGEAVRRSLRCFAQTHGHPCGPASCYFPWDRPLWVREG
jgi:putative protease